MCLDNLEYPEVRIAQNIPLLESIWYSLLMGMGPYDVEREARKREFSGHCVPGGRAAAWLSVAGVGAGAAGLVKLSVSIRLGQLPGACALHCNPPVTKVMESRFSSCSEVSCTGKALLIHFSSLYQSIQMPSLEALGYRPCDRLCRVSAQTTTVSLGSSHSPASLYCECFCSVKFRFLSLFSLPTTFCSRLITCLLGRVIFPKSPSSLLFY